MPDFVRLAGITEVEFDPLREKYYFSTANGEFVSWDIDSEMIDSTLEVGGRLGGMDLSVDGNFAYIAQRDVVPVNRQGGWPDHTTRIFIEKIDLNTEQHSRLETIVEGYERGSFDVAMGIGGIGLLTTDFAGSAWNPFRQFDTNDDDTISERDEVSLRRSELRQSSHLLESADGGNILILESNSSSAPMHVYNAVADELIASTNNFEISGGGSFNSGAGDISSSAEALVNLTYGFRVFDLQFNELADLRSYDVGSAKFSPDGLLLYGLDYLADELLVFGTNDWTLAATYALSDVFGSESGLIDEIGNTHNPDEIVLLGSGISGADGFALLDLNSTGTTTADLLEGTNADDALFGYGGDDRLLGRRGNDTIEGGDGNDSLEGGAGDDILIGGDGADFLFGDQGSDAASYSDATSGVSADLVIRSKNIGFAEGDRFLSIENLIGSAFDDTLQGDGKNNMLEGLGGDDLLRGRGGNDTLLGLAGDDILLGEEGADSHIGGIGFDIASHKNATAAVRADLHFTASNTGEASGDTYTSIEGLQGTRYDDTLNGNGGRNTLIGLAGDDYLNGRGGVDKLYGGGGNDVFIGSEGRDIFDGGAGTDRVQYQNATREVRADLQNSLTNLYLARGDVYRDIEDLRGSSFGDSLGGDRNANRIEGLDGDDVLLGRQGDDWLLGGDGDDLLIGGTGADALFGGEGSDIVYYTDATSRVLVDLAAPETNVGAFAVGDTYSRIESVLGTSFDDILRGDGGDNMLFGTGGDDRLTGRNGDDVLNGGEGDDILYGDNGADTLIGGEGTDRADYSAARSGLIADLTAARLNSGLAEGDTYASVENLRGGQGDDDLRGNARNNRLEGMDGDDYLTGRSGTDSLFGGRGNDTLTAFGNDLLVGGSGNDTFRFNTATVGAATISDFRKGEDKIVLDDAGFASLTPGALSADNFRVAGVTPDADDYIIFANGSLYYDADGSGNAPLVRFAIIANNADLDQSDFLIV